MTLVKPATENRGVVGSIPTLAIEVPAKDLDELTDTDRENTRHLYERTFQVVEDLSDQLRVIALYLADVEEEWFAGSVVQRSSGEEALIPQQ